MERTIEQWKNCDPETMATKQSDAAIIFAFKAAKHDILELYAKAERLQKEVDYLRRYGNKDCTAMADEALEKGEQCEDIQSR